MLRIQETPQPLRNVTNTNRTTLLDKKVLKKTPFIKQTPKPTLKTTQKKKIQVYQDPEIIPEKEVIPEMEYMPPSTFDIRNDS